MKTETKYYPVKYGTRSLNAKIIVTRNPKTWHLRWHTGNIEADPHTERIMFKRLKQENLGESICQILTGPKTGWSRKFTSSWSNDCGTARYLPEKVAKELLAKITAVFEKCTKDPIPEEERE